MVIVLQNMALVWSVSTISVIWPYIQSMWTWGVLDCFPIQPPQPTIPFTPFTPGVSVNGVNGGCWSWEGGEDPGVDGVNGVKLWAKCYNIYTLHHLH